MSIVIIDTKKKIDPIEEAENFVSCVVRGTIIARGWSNNKIDEIMCKIHDFFVEIQEEIKTGENTR